MKKILTALFIILVASGCTVTPAVPQEEGSANYVLELYQTRTATASATPSGPGTATPLPAPTLTPRSYAIRRGDTFSVIAFNYGVSIASLRTANPDVDPNFLIVGTVLAVPPAEPVVYGTPVIPTPTPVSLDLSEPFCSRSAEGGVWCFVEVANNLPVPVENVIVTILLANSETGEVLQQEAITPLNLLPAGISQPAYAFFPSPAPASFEVQAHLTTAMMVPDGNARYLTVTTENTTTTIALSGSSARVTGEVVLTDPAAQFALIWVSVTAYDSQGRIIGVRRWESRGSSRAFDFSVYATTGEISRVNLLAEARP
jgi:LysM repeat protein